MKKWEKLTAAEKGDLRGELEVERRLAPCEGRLRAEEKEKGGGRE